VVHDGKGFKRIDRSGAIVGVAEVTGHVFGGMFGISHRVDSNLFLSVSPVVGIVKAFGIEDWPMFALKVDILLDGRWRTVFRPDVEAPRPLKGPVSGWCAMISVIHFWRVRRSIRAR
jgi:hypothetical protein